eukprot:31436-Pelagococcus_subviridis.AAC.6
MIQQQQLPKELPSRADTEITAERVAKRDASFVRSFVPRRPGAQREPAAPYEPYRACSANALNAAAFRALGCASHHVVTALAASPARA